MKVSRKKRVRNYQMRDKLKDTLKEVQDAAKSGNADKAQKALQAAYKIIDTSAKKNIIHNRNADRKKASMAKLVANMSVKKATKAAPAKKVAPKEEKKEEKK